MCEYENKIICLTNQHVNVLCLTINLIPSSVFYDEMLLRYENFREHGSRRISATSILSGVCSFVVYLFLVMFT